MNERLDPQTMERLRAIAETRRFPAETFLCTQGQPGDCCYLILSGEVEVRRDVGTEILSVARLGPGAMVGQLALVDGSPRAASVVVTAPVTAVVLTREVFETLRSAHSTLALHFQRQVALAGIRQLRHATAHLARLQLQRAHQPGGTPLLRRDRRVATITIAGLSELSVDLQALARELETVDP